MKKIKVSTREIVIVAVMLIVVLYGAYDYFVGFVSKPVGNGDERAAQIDALIAQVSKTLEAHGAYPVYAAFVTRAESEWKRDPFYREIVPVKTTTDRIDVVYTGYLEIGTRRLTVIDGVSYGPGDELERGGYLVTRIQPSSVVIKGKKSGKTIIVPLWGEE